MMDIVQRRTIEEFHYALDGRNPRRWVVGSDAEIRLEDVQDLGRAGKIALLPADGVAEPQPLMLTQEERADLPALEAVDPDGEPAMDPEPVASASIPAKRKGRSRK